MREKIKQVAEELLIIHGYHGFRFIDVADRLGLSRSNIHYHFGSKSAIVEEVVLEYIENTLQTWQQTWAPDESEPYISLFQKIEGAIEFSHRRYLRFNPTGVGGRPWSLISRMRLERDLLTDKAREALVDYRKSVEGYVITGVSRAIDARELRRATPVKDIAAQLVTIIDTADPITRDAGRFDRLRQVYSAFARIIEDAYGA